MICVELSFSEDSRRLEARPAHRQRLNEWYERGELLLAGPWADDSGALLLFLLDRAGVERALAADPYFATPGVRVVAVRDWRPVVGAEG